jgi:hypothetical protein
MNPNHTKRQSKSRKFKESGYRFYIRNVTGLSFVFKLSCNSIIKLGFCHRSVDQQNRLRYQLLKIKSAAIRAVLRKSVTL